MEYVLHRKSNCKKIKIRVVKGVVQVSAPFYVSKREIDDFVKEQETWIKNQLSKYTVSKENDKIPLLGNAYRLHYIDQRKCYVEDYDLYTYRIFLYNMAFIKVSGAAVHQVNVRFVSM